MKPCTSEDLKIAFEDGDLCAKSRSLLERAQEFVVHATCSVPDDEALCVRARALLKDMDPHIFLDIKRALRESAND